jgi:hypothetical protein
MKIILQTAEGQLVIETATLDHLHGVSPEGSEWFSRDGQVWYTDDGDGGEIAVRVEKKSEDLYRHI